jgi:iron-sulfur cluster repair protein YtfE (RIC family)
MDAIQFLKQEHEEFKAKFRQLEQASSPQEQLRLWNTMKPDLKLHEQMETRYLYGPVEQDARAQGTVLSHYEQDHEQDVKQADMMIQQIDSTNPSDPQWLSLVLQLRDTLLQHMQEEETQIWPEIRQVWDQGRIDQAGQQMQQMHQQQAGSRTS